MAYSIYDATAPLCAQQLTALLGICDKAAAYCADKKVDEAWLLTDRLAPDMFWPASRAPISPLWTRPASPKPRTGCKNRWIS